MNIEVLLTEAEIAHEFTESMEARDLPEKFFYWFPLSVQAWSELSQDAAYQDLRSAWSAIGEKAREIAGHFEKKVPVVSFGAGDGSKDRVLIQALKAAGHEVQYFPVDASQALLETACSGAEDDDVEVLGIKADISSPMHMVLASDACESPKLFLMAGNSLGGFDPLEMAKSLADCMHTGDRLLIDGSLYADGAVAGFEQPRSHRFAFAPLASIGIAEEDGQLKFEQKRDDRHPGLYMITKRFHAQRDLRITVSGSEIVVARGERIFMNFQYLYTPEAFRWLLREHAGLRLLDENVSADGKFITAVCAK
ncbi:MAG: L-histidine N(alpha)-methyltransferase [Acidobacteriota bacterium]|nr:L-histidine N(alpha)-methyltransferase [Acidobacteriota bacterium]